MPLPVSSNVGWAFMSTGLLSGFKPVDMNTHPMEAV